MTQSATAFFKIKTAHDVRFLFVFHTHKKTFHNFNPQLRYRSISQSTTFLVLQT